MRRDVLVTAIGRFGSTVRVAAGVNATGDIVAEFSAAEIEAGRRLFAGEWNFRSAAGSLDSLPPMGRA
jgi:hypothetical protein